MVPDGAAAAPSLDDVLRQVRQEAEPVRAPSGRPLSKTTLLIAMLPRTGSTALCSLLESTGMLGDPREYFNPRGVVRAWARRLSASDLDEYLDALRREQATPNGVFSVKTLYPDLEPLLDRKAIGDLLDQARFVYLTREDMVAQAISAYIADSSGIWHRDRTGARFRSRGGGDPDPPYDEARILAQRESMLKEQSDWESFFASRGVEPLRITYEEFVADAATTVTAIARHAGVEWTGDLSLEAAATSRLADARNERWAERLRASGRA